MDLNKLYKNEAEQYLVGGVSAAWNYLSDVGPIYFKKAEGSKIIDVNNNEYIDYISGWGSLFLGHNPKVIRESMLEAFEVGFGFQYETDYHLKLAKLMVQSIPCAEKVRLCNSGTEATMNALRIARTKTKRNKIIKFEGHFHGHHDYMLYSMDTSPYLGEKLNNGGFKPTPGSSGIPKTIDDLVIPIPFNDIESFIETVEKNKEDIAAVILEPISLNIGCIFPDEGFLQKVRDICTKENIILIFDEVLTGFRVDFGGAQKLYNVIPDLACYGKAFGCGMPIAAIAGKSEYMDSLEPVGKSQMSGTNTGRVLSVVGTYNVLKELNDDSKYNHINKLNETMVSGIHYLLDKYNIPGNVQGIGGRIAIHFGLEQSPRDYRYIIKNFNKEYATECYKKAMNDYQLYGFFLPLSNCPEPITFSMAHTIEDIEETLNRVETIFKETPYFKK